MTKKDKVPKKPKKALVEVLGKEVVDHFKEKLTE